MNPILVRRLVTAAVGLLGAAGAAYGADQHDKRKQDQEAHRARLQEIEEDLSSKEDDLEALRSLLGGKNDQVRILAAQIEILRGEAAALRGSS